MSNLVKKSQLSEVTVALWDAVKSKYDGALLDVTYDATTQVATFTDVAGQAKTVDLSNLVSLDSVANEANKIPQIGADGKLDTAIIPEIAINRVLTVADKDEAIAKFGEGEDELQTGDIVIIASEQNSLFMFNGTVITDVADFDTAFIQLTIGEGTVKTVNGETPDSTGAVALDLEVDQTTTADVVLTLGDKTAIIGCMTQADVQAIIAQFV